jgi:hypothetical protein
MNPIIALKELKQKELNFNSKFIVTFIRDDSKYDDDNYLSIKEYCKDNNIAFIIRNYDSTNFEEDCNYILKLPAYHMHSQKKRYIKTFYDSDNVIRIIEKEIAQAKIEKEKKRLRKEWYRSFISWVWN